MREFYIGLMSGTSLDGIDAALVDLSTRPPRVLRARTLPFAAETRALLLQLAQGGAQNEIELLGRADTLLGELFATAALSLLDDPELAPDAVRAIGSHGQTVRHRPHGPQPFTLQIGDPNVIAARTGITTVADFRRRDLALGGQGAPLVPAFHAACFRSPDQDRAVLNLGGMANLTLLPADPEEPVGGFDTGPGNVLMDAWIGAHQGLAHDQDGAWGARGKVIQPLLERLLSEDYFSLAPPKSTGRELFHLGWLENYLADNSAEPVDIQATLCELTAVSVASALHRWARHTQRLLVCGGGVHNRHLMARLRAQLPDQRVESTADWGLDPDWVEAAAFAWMARETLAGRPSNLPGVTGACALAPLGGIYLAQ
ncbi:MAG: anhydro-N-acetylmuramic acid kinase [Gammaproteobacteria bacterium]